MADYWLKLYVEIIDDPKMATLPDALWRRCVELFVVAKRANKDGLLPPVEQIAWMLRRPVAEIQSQLDELAPTGILTREKDGTYRVTNFARRQAASTEAERKAHQRARERSAQYEEDEESEQAEKRRLAAEKKAASVNPEEKAWLDKIMAVFAERFPNPAAVRTALMIRSQFGEDKGMEAILWYSHKGRPIGESLYRAHKALPTWGTYQKDPPGKRNGSQQRPTTPAPTFDVGFARAALGLSDAQIKAKMRELGIPPEVIAQQLGAAA